MVKPKSIALGLLLLFAAGTAAAAPRHPVPLLRGEDLSTGAAPPRRESRLSALARAAAGQQRIRSVPTFSGQLTAFDGSSYPYTMVGHPPEEGGTTRIANVVLPVSLTILDFVDDQGNPITLPAPDMKQVLQSPEWQPASFATGFTQFSDAVQRAQFWNVMAPGWHTVLAEPRVMPELNIIVPPNLSEVSRLPDGTLVAKLDINFFNSQLSTVMQLAGFSVHELAMLLTQNVMLYSADGGFCCARGFHSDQEVRVEGDTHFLQTYLWASWATPGNPLGFNLTDVTALSHEIAEWYNDPFGTNAVPLWQMPGGPPGACNPYLETGDAIKYLPGLLYAIDVDGVTYHPQNEALLQWFGNGSEASAYHGAYSFPDTSVLTAPAMACPAQSAGQTP
jgi:hypothetical protein